MVISGYGETSEITPGSEVDECSYSEERYQRAFNSAPGQDVNSVSKNTELMLHFLSGQI
jgi:hypothetical protein